jgi:hypothetical protein
VSACAECERLRVTLVRIAELIEDGLPDAAYDFAIAAVEPPAKVRYRCALCDQRFEWPGALREHFCPVAFGRELTDAEKSDALYDGDVPDLQQDAA